MTITVSNATQMVIMNLVYATLVGCTSDVSSLLIKDTDQTEREAQKELLLPFVNTNIDVTVEGKITFHLRPVRITISPRFIDFGVAQGDTITWS